MEVDLSRFGALEPQMDEVAQGSSLPQWGRLFVVLSIELAFDWDREGSLPQECLMAGGHFSQIIHHHKHLHHCLIGVK